MAVKRGIWLIFVIFLIFSLVISAYTASARKVLGEDYLIGNVIDNEGEPVANTTIIVYSGTMATQCMLYDGCYCNAPRCGSEVETDENGQYSLNLSDLLFEEDYYCNEGAGPEINLTSSDRCAPLTTDTHYCASASEGCVNDSAEYMLAYTNDSMPLVWANLWNTDETRYEYRAVGLFEICSIENLRPEIQGTIPSQSGTEGTSWTYDLKPRMDTEINRYWVVSGVSSPLLDISINSNHVATFNPKREGTDTVLFELYSETQNISDSQEVSVSVSGTPEDISTVNISIAGGETVARRLFSGFNCGDGVCSMDENCLNCPDDCGSCPGCDPCVIVVDVCRAPAGEEIPPSGEMPRLRIPWGILVALTALGAGGLAAWLLSKETLLIVSSRNLARGPLAQEALKSMLRERKLDGKYNVKSAGILAHGGHVPSAKMKSMADSLGVDLSNFQTNALTEKDIKKAKHILFMDPKQKDFVIDHLLNRDKANLENKIHVLNVKPPKGETPQQYKTSFSQIKKSLEEKFSKITGLKEGPKSGPKIPKAGKGK